jgi:hypothetical protein
MKDLIRFLVAPSRLTRAGWDSTEVSGDIYCSYSADTIAESNKVRKPFYFQGNSWITTGLYSHDDAWTAEAYRLVPKAISDGQPTTYRRKTSRLEDAEAAREDPMGFYHGMTVTQGRETYVLSGPPATFAAGAATGEEPVVAQEPMKQLSLF